MLKYLLIITLLLGVFEIRSQTIDVKYFSWLDNNGQREGMPRIDTVFNNCSVIKVITHQAGFTFDFATAGKAFTTIQEKDEIWLWVPASAEKINIINKVTGISCSYPFGKELEVGEVYAMELVMDSKKVNHDEQVETKWININTFPFNTKLFIDNYPVNNSPFYGSLILGKHKVRMEKYGKKKEKTITVSDITENPFSLDLKIKSIRNDSIDEEILIDPDPNPEYPGGFEQLFKFIHDNTNFPDTDADVQGTVLVQFMVSETGNISKIHILRGIGCGCDEEAIRVVKMMPKWIPARRNGYAIPSLYQIPIKFQRG